MKEHEVINIARQRLIDRGYKIAELYSDYLIDERYRADLVVFQQEKPYLVVEVKENRRLKFDSNLEYRFDPAVRQVQSFANYLKAPFFALFDGYNFSFFTSDKTGRPLLISDVLTPEPNKAGNIANEIRKSFTDLRNYFTHSLRNWTLDQLLVLLYAQILSELGSPSLKNDFLAGRGDEYDLLMPFDKNSYIDKENLQEVFHKLERITYLSTDTTELLLVLDEVFFTKSSIFLPRWVSDLMVKMANLENGKSYLDFFSINGNFVAPILLNNPRKDVSTIKAVFLDQKIEYWLKIQELLLCRKELWHLGTNPLKAFPSRTILSKIDRIFLAPAFGGNNLYVSEYSGETFNDNLEFLMEKALKIIQRQGLIVSIVPDSFLFSAKYKNIRNILRESGEIISLVSLPTDTFKPFSQLKSSILVYQKGGLDALDLYVGKISEAPPRDTFDSGSLKNVKIVSDNFNHWIAGENFDIDDSNSYLLRQSELDYENLISVYNTSQSKQTNETSNYNLLPLADVCLEIQRGAPIKLDKNGKIPFLNPASIRELRIDDTKLGLTSEEKQGTKAPRVHKGDIVVNAISTYRGAAALINSDFDGLLINSQVVLIRPWVEKILPEYLSVILNTKYIQEQIRTMSSGAVISFIPLQSLKELLIPVPSIIAQNHAIKSIEEAKKKVTESQDRYKEATEQLARLLKDFKIEGENP